MDDTESFIESNALVIGKTKYALPPVHSALKVEEIDIINHPAYNRYNVTHRVVATQNILPGTFLGCYAGEIKLWQHKTEWDPYIVQPFEDSEYYVTGINQGNTLRFINDYRGMKTAPNVEIEYHNVEYGLYRTVIFRTLEFITEGEELLVDYGDDYWDQREVQLMKFACDEPNCTSRFDNPNSLSKHIRRNHPAELIDCDYCDRSFKRIERFNDHMNFHTGKKPHLCKYEGCDKCFHTTDDRGKHYAKEHKPKKRKYKFQCYECDEKFTESKYLAQHIEKEHDDTIYYCNDTSEHDEPVEFTTLRSYQEHMNHFHGDNPPKVYLCTHCNVPYDRKKSFNRHVKYVVNKEPKPYQCSICDAGFIQSSDYNRHINGRKHKIKAGIIPKPAKKNYGCELCQFTGKYPRDLQRHLKTQNHKINAGIIPKPVKKIYGCELCQFTAKYSRDLQRHLETQNHKIKAGIIPKPVKKPRDCELCQFTGKYPRDLQRHLKTKNHERNLKKQKIED